MPLQNDLGLYSRLFQSPLFSAGSMEQSFTNFLDEARNTSYSRLVGSYDCSDQTVLDLPCGSGALAKLIAKSGRSRRIFAVDQSDREIALLKKVAGTDITAIVGSAQNLVLDDLSIDVVFSHLGLIVFDPIRPVLAELRRVLSHRGVVVFNTIDANQSEVFKVFARHSTEFETQLPKPVSWGDPATHEQEAWNNLFHENEFGLEEDAVYSVGYRGEIPDVIRHSVAFFQVPYLLSEAQRQAYFSAIFESTQQHKDEKGQIRLDIKFRRLMYRKRG